MRRASTQRLLATLVLSLPALASASACLYKGADATARVINRSGEITTPFPEPLSSPDCRRLRVATGEVAVYALAGTQTSPEMRRVSSGALIVGAGNAPTEAGGVPQLMQQIKSVLDGGQRLRSGSSRGANEDYILTAIPSGRLAEPQADLLVPLGQAADADLASFELSLNGKVVHRQQGPAQELRLPAAQLKRGNTLQWALNYAGQRHQGQIVVEDPALLAQRKQDLLQLSQGEPDPLLRQLRLAAALVDEGQVWAAREIIRASLTP
ncbi:hypothetical protein LNV09_05855 [Paucibacter sp. B2R-40]|uniref:hypothetical protein n=1 Tax=Paucibacter sp. B2R-40 TaxID=2893554 RepID=UPI0021E3FBD4|nr:hypothetical protein [Paucibacter sp. B2R-40]MCV2353685.1 hypothetical protein [Paucibacter sp. B2R-40]